MKISRYTYKKLSLASTIMTILMSLTVLLIGFLPMLAVHAEWKENDVNTAQIDKFIESAMERLNIPGVAIGIVKGNQAVYLKGYGISGPDKTPVTPQTPFILGSTSKSITAVAVMQLVDEGKIDLEAPVQHYLPWFRVADEEASKKILVKHLLNQTSGLSTHSGQVSLTKGNKTLDQHLKSLKGTELIEPVGSVFQYSNLNYDILGGIVQEVSGTSFAEYVKTNIFRTLDMSHSYALPEEAKSDGLATGYQPVFGIMIPTKQLNHEGTVPSGYLISSSEDMTKYLAAQMNRGHFGNKTLLSEKSIEEMHKPVAPMWGDTFYAMGWTVNNNIISHDGSTENTYSKMLIDGDYSIILLINAMDFFHIDSYDSMMTGIDGLLHGQEPLQAGMSDYKKTYLILDLIALAVLVYIAWSIYGLFKWKTRFKATPFRIFIKVLFTLLLNLLVPLAFLIIVPKLLVPWSVTIAFLPGFGHFMFIIPILLLCVGVAKTVLIIRSIFRKTKQTIAV